jgi:hypothetical protein
VAPRTGKHATTRHAHRNRDGVDTLDLRLAHPDGRPARRGDARHRLAEERGPLLQAIALAFLLTTLAGASFFGEIRTRAWRPAAHLALAAALLFAGWVYWPK